MLQSRVDVLLLAEPKYKVFVARNAMQYKEEGACEYGG